MSEYRERHYEDVARILAVHDAQWRPTEAVDSGKHRPVMAIAKDFANLFAADNPPVCLRCGKRENSEASCWPEPPEHNHSFAGGFGRGRFLKACGLEPRYTAAEAMRELGVPDPEDIPLTQDEQLD